MPLVCQTAHLVLSGIQGINQVPKSWLPFKYCNIRCRGASTFLYDLMDVMQLIGIYRLLPGIHAGGYGVFVVEPSHQCLLLVLVLVLSC